MKHSLAIAAALAVLLVACGKEEQPAVPAAPAEQAAPAAPAAEAPAAPAAEAPAVEAPAAEPAAPAPAEGAPAPAAPAAEAPAVEAPAAEPAAPAPAEGAPAPSSQAPATAPTQGQSGALDMEAGKALAKSSGCFACHQVETKRVGPAWQDVANKYKGNADAKKMMAEWIHKGGSGRWQMGVMPAYSPRVSDADIDKLVDFIIALDKG